MKKLVFVFFFILSLHVNAQFFLTGVEPFSTKWSQIKTKNFRIIFPSESEKKAFRYANLLSVIDTFAPNSLNAKQKPFDVVLHNNSVLSNGLVAWAPKRMEIISHAPMSTYSQPWLTQLAIHETRHTSQIYKLDEGFVKFSSLFFGEQAVGLSAGMVPSWFLEGDAVAFETAVSNSGRGRQADFYQYYRAHYLNQKQKFKYDKWLLGSYKDNIPDHYNFGYQLVSYAKQEYGNDVWANTLKTVSRKPFLILPFYFGLKQETGLSRKKLFQKTFDNLDSIWHDSQIKNNVDSLSTIINEFDDYNDYRYPFILNDSLLIVYKKNLKRIPCFSVINLKNKKEKTLFKPGYLTSIPSYYKENVFWSEYKAHVRWEYVNYSIIKWYNIATGQIKTISDKGRYYSPVYNPSDNLIYAISSNKNDSYSIDAFDLNGEKVKRINIPEEYQPFELVLAADKKSFLVGVVTNRGKSIINLFENGSYVNIFDSTFLDIHSLAIFNNFILFSTTNNYKEDLFAFNQITRKVFSITNSPFGATDPFFDSKSNKIVYSNFTSKGYSISEVALDTLKYEIILPKVIQDCISERISHKEKFNVDSIELPTNTYTVERYKGVKTLFNIHSWAPFYYDPTQLSNGVFAIKPGLTLISQNLTGTSVLTGAYGYEKSSLVHINYQYYGLFPVFSYSFDLSNNYPFVYFVKNTSKPIITEKRKETNLSLYLPLKLSSSRFSSSLYPFIQLISSNDYLLSVSDSLYHKGYHRFNYRLYFSILQRQAFRDMRPILGFTANIEYENAPFNRNNKGTLFASTFNFYIPGIAPNHSLLVKWSIQKQELKKYYFSNRIAFPRGYIGHQSERLNKISTEYLFPILYPDIALGSIAYLKRISVNPFFDYAQNSFPISKISYQKETMKSFGFEVFFDFKLFRTRYPIQFMFQQGWKENKLLPFSTFNLFVDFYSQ